MKTFVTIEMGKSKFLITQGEVLRHGARIVARNRLNGKGRKASEAEIDNLAEKIRSKFSNSRKPEKASVPRFAAG